MSSGHGEDKTKESVDISVVMGTYSIIDDFLSTGADEDARRLYS